MEFDVWITKYGLSQGIIKRRAKRCFAPTMIETVKLPTEYMQSYYHKPDWWESEQEAKARVVEMAKAKLKSIEKQAKKFRQIVEQNGN